MALAVTYTNFGGQLVSEDRGGTKRDYVSDTLGSTIAMMDSSGDVTDTWEYWPYGEVSSHTGDSETPFTFVGTLGYFKDLVSSLTYVRARFYQAFTGQWMTMDPLWPIETAFGYCYGRPTVFSDPLGLDPPLGGEDCEYWAWWLTYFGNPGKYKGESKASAFIRCQRNLENANRMRVDSGLRPVCPGGNREICVECSRLSGLPMNCDAHSCVVKGFNDPAGGGLPISIIGAVGFPFGQGSGSLRKCLANCRAFMQNKGWESLCTVICTTVTKFGCDRLFSVCVRMKEPESDACMDFYLAFCFGE